MPLNEPPFSIGIEEEYLLVDKETRDLVSDPPPELIEKCAAALEEGQVTAEFLRSQIEVGTRVCESLGAAKKELRMLRKVVAETAAEYGLAPVASSTHPFAKWSGQAHTDKERYNLLAEDMQVVARRMLICGMHVHVGIADDELRIDLMNQASYFLPHLLALSTSSPFWQGELTGLKSYRLSVFDELPRTGIPEQFTSYSEYQRTVEVLVNAAVIEDSSKIWWDMRPSAKFPTVEMRVTDVCTLVDDAIAVAALFLCVCRLLYRLRRRNQRWRFYSPFLIHENRWRAQRYGCDEGLVDFGRGEIVPMGELLDELMQLIAKDMEHFGCADDIARTREIAAHGTSADRQIRRYKSLLSSGASQEDALKGVVDGLIEETVEGL